MMELKRVCVVFRNQEVLQTKSGAGRMPDPKPVVTDPTDPDEPDVPPVIPPPELEQ